MGALRGREEIFCQKFVRNGRNGTRAAADAGYSAKSAHVIAHRLLKKDKVADRIQEITSEILNSCEVTDEMIKAEIVAIAFQNIVDDTMKAVDVNEQKHLPFDEALIANIPYLSSRTTKAIAGIERTKEGVKVRTWDKMSALKLLAEIRQMSTSKVDVNMSLSPANILDIVHVRRGESSLFNSGDESLAETGGGNDE